MEGFLYVANYKMSGKFNFLNEKGGKSYIRYILDPAEKWHLW